MPGVAYMFGAVLSVQFGGALAATLIPQLGPVGTVTLRLVLGALILIPLGRPTLRGHSRRDWLAVLALALALGAMNTSFYFGLRTLPIGVAVTIEFIGPLSLAAVGSRSPRDGLAVLLAACGVVAVSGALDSDWSRISLPGIGFELLAGAAWACYAKASQTVGAHWAQLHGLTWAMILCAAAMLPFGIATSGTALVCPRHLLAGAGVALLSSAVPYSLEMYALRRLSTKAYGILTGLEPAVAALAGLLVLGQGLRPLQILGMAAVIAASWLVMAHARSQPSRTG